MRSFPRGASFPSSVRYPLILPECRAIRVWKLDILSLLVVSYPLHSLPPLGVDVAVEIRKMPRSCAVDIVVQGCMVTLSGTLSPGQ